VCLPFMVVIQVNHQDHQAGVGDFLPHQWSTETPHLLDNTLMMQFQ
jgi:hypothetical protein